jgi:suppressor of ftsI
MRPILSLAALLCLCGCLFETQKPPEPRAAPEDFTQSVEGLEAARPQRIIDAKDGDTVELTAGPVKKMLGGREVRMLAFDGSIPGPTIRAPQGARITVLLRNHLGFPTTLHSHGVRLDYRYDGTTEVQPPIPDGGSFAYLLKFPDAGIYWYHGHVREDYSQQMGLYGSYLVAPRDSAYWEPADREVVLMIQDLLSDSAGIVPTSKSRADHAMMGRFGNVFLVNGDTAWRLQVKRKELVRFFITNACDARVLNLGLRNRDGKVVGSDNGAYPRPIWGGFELLAPGERMVLEGYFDDTVPVTLAHQMLIPDRPPQFVPLGVITAGPDSTASGYGDGFFVNRSYASAEASIDSLKPWFDRPPDKNLLLTVRMGGMSHGGHAGMKAAAPEHNPEGMGIEWTDHMGLANSATTSEDITWIIRDLATGKENHDIRWDFPRGDKVMIRIYNDSASMHPMPHPIHFHGQRFLVVRENGQLNDWMTWKDTYLVGRGRTVDLLLDASNPGSWVAHCHISEHMEASMMFHFQVE